MVMLDSKNNFIGSHSLDIPVDKIAVAVIEVVEMLRFVGMSSQFVAAVVVDMTDRFAGYSSRKADSVTGVVEAVVRTHSTVERLSVDYTDSSIGSC